MMLSNGEDQIVCHWIRSHIFAYGLFERPRRKNDAWFLTEQETLETAQELAAIWRSKHLEGQFLPCRLDSDAIFLMLDTGAWGDDCKAHLDKVLSDDAAVDGFVLMLFGGKYTVEKSTIARLCSDKLFAARVNERLEAGMIDDSLRYALQKATGQHM